MATRKSKPRPISDDYTATPLEDRIRQLEKRSRRNDQTRAWETSLAYRLTISAAIYVTTALVLIALLIPAGLFIALIPVICYWMTLLLLNVARDMWNAPKPDNRKV